MNCSYIDKNDIISDKKEVYNYAMWKQARDSIRSAIMSGDWSEIDSLADMWKNSKSDISFAHYLVEVYISRNKEMFESYYHEIKWAKDNIPRHLLNDWCKEHGHDFITICRVIDDKELIEFC